MLKTIAYVIRSFPEPSETFIADEAVSLLNEGLQPCIIHLYDGNAKVLHPAAQTLLENAPRLKVQLARPPAILSSLVRWLMVSPVRTIRTLKKALRAPDRWCYFQALEPAWWCRQQGVDLLHAHFADVNFQYAARISEWSSIPFSVTTHGYDLREDPLGKDEVSALYQQAFAVVTISEFNRQYMEQKYGLPRSRIEVVHCGINLERFKYFPRLTPTPNKPYQLLNVGRLAPQKGQDVLLRTMALLIHRGIDVHLNIVGAGELELQLKSLADELGLAKCVSFLGAKNEQEIRALHQCSDVFVLPSRAEGLPVACMEALAAGTTCVATRINGIPELIEDGVNGLLVEAEDAAGLAEAIGKLQADPELAQRLRLGGRKTVQSEFDRILCTKQLISIWNQENIQA